MSEVYPPAPWQMHGQLWLSIFRVRDTVDDLRVKGVYGVAWVDYEAPSPLSYSELLVARPITEPERGVSITDIWVDSVASVAGGRELWAIPKGLCDFEHTSTRRGPLSSARWRASDDDKPIASARFRDLSRAAPRVPFKGRTWQPELISGLGSGQGAKSADLKGTARVLPCLGSWEFNPDGALGWLSGRRPLASFRMADFRMSFG